MTMGILVDQVLEVLPIEVNQIEPPPTFGTTTISTNFILRIGKADKRVIFLVNISKVLNADEVSALVSTA